MTEKEYEELYERENNKITERCKTLSECSYEEYYEQGSEDWCNKNGIDYEVSSTPTLANYLEEYGRYPCAKTAKVRSDEKVKTFSHVTDKVEKPINGKQFKAIRDRAKKNFKNYLIYIEQGKLETAKGAFANVEKDCNLLKKLGWSFTLTSDTLDIDKYRDYKNPNLSSSDI